LTGTTVLGKRGPGNHTQRAMHRNAEEERVRQLAPVVQHGHLARGIERGHQPVLDEANAALGEGGEDRVGRVRRRRDRLAEGITTEISLARAVHARPESRAAGARIRSGPADTEGAPHTRRWPGRPGSAQFVAQPLRAGDQ
jgi:hypothetical protein